MHRIRSLCVSFLSPVTVMLFSFLVLDRKRPYTLLQCYLIFRRNFVRLILNYSIPTNFWTPPSSIPILSEELWTTLFIVPSLVHIMFFPLSACQPFSFSNLAPLMVWGNQSFNPNLSEQINYFAGKQIPIQSIVTLIEHLKVELLYY